MNARLPAPRGICTAKLFYPCDEPLEREALGVALLGYPLPDWMAPEHFFLAQHRLVFSAVQELGTGASLPSVAALLRDRGELFQKGLHGQDRHASARLSSVDLFGMMNEAQHTMAMGWAVEFEHLRELSDRRRLLEAARRAVVVLEGDGTAEAAREILKGAMGE